ncbi:hypothetical protein ACWY4P_54055 (plasmid) [Streptomyces sp. LZ34]
MRECTTDAVELTPEEIQHLSQLPGAAHEVKSPLECELEDGHAGPHCALGQSDDLDPDDVTHWWLRWSSESREWTHEPTCYLPDDDAPWCPLPAGHEGAHNWSP